MARNICAWISIIIILGNPLDRYEKMRVPPAFLPKHTIKPYDLRIHAKNDFLYVKKGKSICGLPQAGELVNKILKEIFSHAGYFEVPHTPSLWTHITRPVQFTLVEDDFDVKFTVKYHTDHLVRALKNNYKKSTDWTEGLYCVITLQWDKNQGRLDFSMTGYIKNQLKNISIKTH